MRKGLFSGPHCLHAASGSGERHVPKEHLRCDLPARAPRIPDPDPPAPGFAGRHADAKDAAGRCQHKRPVEPPPPQDAHHPVDRVSLADAAGVDFHSFDVKSHRAGLVIQLNVAVTHPGQRSGDILPARRRSASPEESPRLHEGADGYVECPLASAAVPQAPCDQPVHFRRHLHGPLSGETIDLAPRARSPPR